MRARRSSFETPLARLLRMRVTSQVAFIIPCCRLGSKAGVVRPDGQIRCLLLMVRSASLRVSNHEGSPLILRDAACAAPQDEGHFTSRIHHSLLSVGIKSGGGSA